MIPILRASDAGELKRRVMNRSQLQNEEVSRIVKEIVARVRQEGDAALFDYTAKFDHVTMIAETVLVTKDEIARAYAAASPEWLDAMREAARRITAFHEKQRQGFVGDIERQFRLPRRAGLLFPFNALHQQHDKGERRLYLFTGNSRC